LFQRWKRNITKLSQIAYEERERLTEDIVDEMLVDVIRDCNCITEAMNEVIFEMKRKDTFNWLSGKARKAKDEMLRAEMKRLILMEKEREAAANDVVWKQLEELDAMKEEDKELIPVPSAVPTHIYVKDEQFATVKDLKQTQGYCSCLYNGGKVTNYRAFTAHRKKMINAPDSAASATSAASAASDASGEKVINTLFPIPLPVDVVARIFGFCRQFLSDRPRTAKASAMKQIATTQVGNDDSDDDSDDDASDDDNEDGAVAEPVRKKQRTGGGSHKWIPDDPDAWTWKSKKGKGRCECGCVVDQSWHTFNRKTKGK